LAEVKSAGGDGIILQCDVADSKAVKRMFEQFKEKAGSIDAVFNNAGITGPISPIQDLDPEELKKVVDTNISGAFFCGSRISKGND